MEQLKSIQWVTIMKKACIIENQKPGCVLIDGWVMKAFCRNCTTGDDSNSYRGGFRVGKESRGHDREKIAR